MFKLNNLKLSNIYWPQHVRSISFLVFYQSSEIYELSNLVEK